MCAFALGREDVAYRRNCFVAGNQGSRLDLRARARMYTPPFTRKGDLTEQIHGVKRRAFGVRETATLRRSLKSSPYGTRVGDRG